MADAVLGQGHHGVAGVYAPALVERINRHMNPYGPISVAGVYAPALVERSPFEMSRSKRASRVAGVYAPALVERRARASRIFCSLMCRRGLRPGLG